MPSLQQRILENTDILQAFSVNEGASLLVMWGSFLIFLSVFLVVFFTSHFHLKRYSATKKDALYAEFVYVLVAAFPIGGMLLILLT